MKITPLETIMTLMEMIHKGQIEEAEVARITPEQLDEAAREIVEIERGKTPKRLAEGIPIYGGRVRGQIVFDSETAIDWASQGKTVIFVCFEVEPWDIDGVEAAHAVLTAFGGTFSSAAIACRGWRKCCVVGADISVSRHAKTMVAGSRTFCEGDFITVDGSTGLVYSEPDHEDDSIDLERFHEFVRIWDRHRSSHVTIDLE